MTQGRLRPVSAEFRSFPYNVISQSFDRVDGILFPTSAEYRLRSPGPGIPSYAVAPGPPPPSGGTYFMVVFS